MSNSWVLGRKAFPLRVEGARGPLCAGLHPDLHLMLPHQSLDVLWVYIMVVQNVNKKVWDVADCIMVKSTALDQSTDVILFLIVAGI